jgi:hypothetical protein
MSLAAFMVLKDSWFGATRTTSPATLEGRSSIAASLTYHIADVYHQNSSQNDRSSSFSRTKSAERRKPKILAANADKQTYFRYGG